MEILRIAQETGREDLNEIYLELVHPGRSRRYGTGSASVSQVSRQASTSSTGTSALSQQLYDTRFSEVADQLAAERAEREALQQEVTAERAALAERLAMLEQFLRQSGHPPSS